MTKRFRDFNRRAVIGAGAGVAAASFVISARAQSEASLQDFGAKAALITGASSGFGRLTALHLARSGAAVVASMRNLKKGKRAEAQELADIASKEKLRLSLVEIDVTKPAQVSSGVAEAHRIAGGALDLLVNNAGIGIGGPIELEDEQAMMEQANTNLLGYHRMARAVLPAMRARKQGLVVNISSQLGRLVLPNIGSYCMTKFGVEAMCEAMAYELAPFGVEVTIIQPGGYPTKIWDNGRRYSDALLERVDAERKDAYSAHTQMARGLMSGQYTTDPMDVPRAIAEIFAMPPGKRPLRRPVHPNPGAAAQANAAMAQIQAAVLSGGAYKDWHAAVAD
jgi:NAD(P)-dependent dehydrogenase (short-subunit alcohol dehydrogenase family)